MTTGESFTIEDVTLGNDSASGMAVHAWIDEDEYWIPYSVIEKIERNPRTKGSDKVTVEYWWAKDKELAE